MLDVNRINNWGGVELEHSAEGEPVEAITIDFLDLPGCDFLKIDVEGMELQVLQGAEETIRKYQPVIYAEADREDKKDALFAYLRSHGYRLYRHEPPLYNPDNYFHNPENVFKVDKILEDGRKLALQIVSYNVLCKPKNAPFRFEGFEEIE